MDKGTKVQIPWLRRKLMITWEPKSRKSRNDNLLYHFRSECVFCFAIGTTDEAACNTAELEAPMKAW
jgi:hypothetical protein